MTKLTLPWTQQGRFLRTLAKTGNVAEACRDAGIDRRLAYRWRDRTPDFARRWKEVLSRATDRLRGELMERALIGRERVVYRYHPTAAHRQVRREIFGSAAAPCREPSLAERLRRAELRMARYEAERGAESGITPPNTHSKE